MPLFQALTRDVISKAVQLLPPIVLVAQGLADHVPTLFQVTLVSVQLVFDNRGYRFTVTEPDPLVSLI